jgi:hypothetical protein
MEGNLNPDKKLFWLGTIENIGTFTKITRALDINADRGRFWIGTLTDVRKNESNISTPFSFPEFDPDRI